MQGLVGCGGLVLPEMASDSEWHLILNFLSNKVDMLYFILLTLKSISHFFLNVSRSKGVAF